MNTFLCSVFVITISYIRFDKTKAIDLSSPCNDWEAYKNEKCFKIFDKVGLQSYEDAQKTCHQQENDSSLVSIRSLEEQEFFSNLLFKNHKVVDTVWIGAKYNSNKFKWTDDSDLSFTNWAEGNPKNKTDYNCVQMTPESSPIGKWVDEPCNKKNLVVCQKMQIWSLSQMQNNLLDAIRYFTDTLTEEKIKHKKELDNLKQNPVPIGFVYFQLPSQPDPKTLWPSVNWKDFSSDYAGHFFRVEGGNAAPFGQSQSDAFQGHDHILSMVNWNDRETDGGGRIVVGFSTKGFEVGTKSKIITDYTNGEPRINNETRPINYSVRIWKRVN